MSFDDLTEMSDDDLDRLIRREARTLGYAHLDDDALERQVFEEVAGDLEHLTATAYRYPLAVASLWSNDSAAMDQRRAVAMLATCYLLLLMGGNRSGKSVCGKQLCVAMAMGGDHPRVIDWLLDNDLPLDLIPEGPGEVFAVARSGADSVRYHREDIGDLAPAEEQSWRMRNTPQEAVLEIAVKGHAHPGRVWFKSIEQGASSYRGKEVRFVWVDEEPDGEVGEEVFEECLRAVSSMGGKILMTFTPHSGFTWVFTRLVDGGEHGARVVRLNTRDNYLVKDAEGVARWLDGMSEEERKIKEHGFYTDLRGLVYPLFTRGDGSRDGPGHLVEPFDVPDDWPRYIGADWGIKNPTAVVWGALGDDDTLYIYRVHKKAGLSYKQQALACHELMGSTITEGVVVTVGEVIEAGWADPSGKDAIRTWRKMEISLRKANNAKLEGFDAVRDRLRPQIDGRPRLKIFSDCADLIGEFESYRWNPRMLDPTPFKVDDHALDATRYLCMGLARYLGTA